MLLDLLASHAAYHPLHPRLRAGLVWLAAQDWSTVADGKVAIDGEALFASIESGTTAAPAARRFESHRRYLDIQYAIAGGERIGWCPAAGVLPGQQAGPDLWFHPEPAVSQPLLLAPGSFAILLPLEAHKPCCHLGEQPATFRKCVVKVDWT